MAILRVTNDCDEWDQNVFGDVAMIWSKQGFGEASIEI